MWYSHPTVRTVVRLTSQDTSLSDARMLAMVRSTVKGLDAELTELVRDARFLYTLYIPVY